jgi:hypothetical protein
VAAPKGLAHATHLQIHGILFVWIFVFLVKSCWNSFWSVTYIIRLIYISKQQGPVVLLMISYESCIVLINYNHYHQ